MEFTTETGIHSYLTSTTYPTCYKTTRLPEGVGGFVYRAYLKQQQEDPCTPSSVIVKHAAPYAARATSWKMTQTRLEFECKALQFLSKPESLSESVRPPRVLHFDKENWILIMEDAGDLPSLKGWTQPGKSVSGASAIGSALGKSLANVHNITAGDEDTKKQFAGNESAKNVSATLYFGMLPDAAKRYGYEGEYIQKAAEQGQRDVTESSEVLTIGDFWTGNVLVKDSETIFVVDMESVKPGTADFDIGQMAAEMYCLAAFRNRELGFALLSGFLRAYREKRIGEVHVAKVAIRVGAHIMVWGTSAWNNEASEEQIKEQLVVADQLLLLGVENDEDGLRSTFLGELFA